MCTLIVLRRAGHPWPVLIAANRDEMIDRPWKPPARHWPDRSDVVGGLDELGGGTWLGLNDEGVVAGVLNRHRSLGPKEGKRSRGELVLDALDHADAVDAAGALADVNPAAYRPFNMVVADNRDAYWLRHTGEPGKHVEVHALPEGLTMVTAFDADDSGDPRIALHRPRFLTASAPEPDDGSWESWESLLASHDSAPTSEGRTSAMCFLMESGFGTSSSSLLALPAVERVAVRPIWRFAPGRPDMVPFEPVGF
jgi:uncharacterized protein with NRDE domain